MNGAGVLEQRDYEFIDAIQSRPVRYVQIILAANILIFVLMVLAAGMPMLLGYGNIEDTLIAFGAKTNPHIDRGEIWRFVTPIFIHIGILHLLSNSYALWMVGPQIEKLYGSARFVILYLATGIAGVAASYWFSPHALSAGASGAIFGLFGVFLVFGLRNRSSVPASFRQAVTRSVLPVIVLNLLIGYSVSFIDNSAHIGGLVAGAALAAVIPFERPGTSTGAGYKMIQAVALVTVLASFVQVYRHYDGRPLTAFGGPSRLEKFLNAVEGAGKAFPNANSAVASGDVAEVIRAKKQTSTSIDQLRNAPSFGTGADKLIQQFLALMQDQYALEQSIEQAGRVTVSHHMQNEENVHRYQIIERDFNEWVRTEGDQYGIELR